jgi:hypothetical protein
VMSMAVTLAAARGSARASRFLLGLVTCFALKVPSDEQPTAKHTSVTLRSPRRRSATAHSMRRVIRCRHVRAVGERLEVQRLRVLAVGPVGGRGAAATHSLRQLAQPHRGPVHALRHFSLDGTDHESHVAQAFLIRRSIAWHNRHARDRMLREVIKRANVA